MKTVDKPLIKTRKKGIDKDSGDVVRYQTSLEAAASSLKIEQLEANKPKKPVDSKLDEV